MKKAENENECKTMRKMHSRRTPSGAMNTHITVVIEAFSSSSHDEIPLKFE